MKKNCLDCGKIFYGWGRRKYCGTIKSKTGCSYENYLKGEKSLKNKIEFLYHNYEWKFNVLRASNYYCSKCNKKGRSRYAVGIYNLPVLYTSRKKQISDIIKEYNIVDETGAEQCDELWDVSSGIVLCVNCHSKKYKKNFINIEKGYQKYLLKKYNALTTTK